MVVAEIFDFRDILVFALIIFGSMFGSVYVELKIVSKW